MNRKYLNSQTSLVVFGILLFHLSTLRGQQIDWSAPYEMRSIFNENKLIQYSPKGFYWMHKYKDEQYYFRRKVAYYTPILEQKKSGENLNLCYDKLKGTYQFSLSIDDTPHLCYSINDKENKKESIFVDPLNQNTLAVHKAPILLFELAYKDKIHDLEGYRYCYSQDASKS